MTYMEQRTISFENHILTYIIRFPNMKLNGKLTSKVLKKLNLEMANVKCKHKSKSNWRRL